ncbi:MAG: DUF4287 domain-containing protein [Candidatus Marinimicrobia bacterium]|nr:DUF4287 domain-containing protein [Candidatus Neomarinimicrobiota bacterium]MCF7829865.1 DUF4287 domain-containing protein [Candidatus Neomarinimicrobiota bacterium]MCF7879172.1 DUF4287 domain-containing protein [Candidatus Neomarinimicrobiota bacterium]
MTREISDDAVNEATGRRWDVWMQILSGSAVADKPHKEIAAWLRNEHGVSHWWSQTITNRYEKETGRRKVGQTAEGTFQIGVQKTVHLSEGDTWERLLSQDGLQQWLGESPGFVLAEGETYETAGGITGEVRVVNDEHIRLTWQPPDWPEASTLQIRVIPKWEEKVTVSFHQEKIPSQELREEMRTRWKAALKALF